MVKNFKVGDVLSESSHYVVTGIYGNDTVLKHQESGDSVHRGFKIQFESRDGRYNCVDMDIEDNNNIRPVNINTIKWLIIGGTKYVVE